MDTNVSTSTPAPIVFDISVKRDFDRMCSFFESKKERTTVYKGPRLGWITAEYIDKHGLVYEHWCSHFIWLVEKWCKCRGTVCESRSLAFILNALQNHAHASATGKWKGNFENPPSIKISIPPYIRKSVEKTL